MCLAAKLLTGSNCTAIHSVCGIAIANDVTVTNGMTSRGHDTFIFNSIAGELLGPVLSLVQKVGSKTDYLL